jgi:hypothetical protein
MHSSHPCRPPLSFVRRSSFVKLAHFALRVKKKTIACFLAAEVGHGLRNTNYLVDKKKRKTKKQWKKIVLFLSDMKFCFFKRLASALEETMSVARPHLGKPESLLIGARRKQSEEVSSSGGSSLSADREADSRCPSSLLRKTSELEGVPQRWWFPAIHIIVDKMNLVAACPR